MTETLDFYVTLRSPYSYLATDRVIGLAQKHSLHLRLRPVYPLALRAPEFFTAGHPKLLGYLRRDAERTAEMLKIPFGWPEPDPIVQDLETSEISDEQPHIRYLTRLVISACHQGRGVALYREVGQVLFGQNGAWNNEDVLKRAADRSGCDWHELNKLSDDVEACEATLAQNAKALDTAGHWGTPTLVYRGEPFFGQDRIDLCDWRIQQSQDA